MNDIADPGICPYKYQYLNIISYVNGNYFSRIVLMYNSIIKCNIYEIQSNNEPEF